MFRLLLFYVYIYREEVSCSLVYFFKRVTSKIFLCLCLFVSVFSVFLFYSGESVPSVFKGLFLSFFLYILPFPFLYLYQSLFVVSFVSFIFLQAKMYCLLFIGLFLSLNKCFCFNLLCFFFHVSLCVISVFVSSVCVVSVSLCCLCVVSLSLCSLCVVSVLS